MTHVAAKGPPPFAKVYMQSLSYIPGAKQLADVPNLLDVEDMGMVSLFIQLGQQCLLRC